MNQNKPGANIVIDQPKDPEGAGKLIELKWSVVFEQRFAVPHPLTQDEYIQLTTEQVQWLKADFLKQLENYPPELLKTLNQYDCLQRETFQQKQS